MHLDVGERISLNRMERPCLSDEETEALDKREKKPNFMRLSHYYDGLLITSNDINASTVIF